MFTTDLGSVTVTVQPVPDPSILAVLAMGGIGMLGPLRRRALRTRHASTAWIGSVPMPTSVPTRFTCWSGSPWQAALRRALLRCVISAACLLAILPAAYAHEDDAPPAPSQVVWGVVTFMVVTIGWTAVCLHIAQRPPKKRFPSPEKHSLPYWLRRWVCWNRRVHRKPPRGSSRPVRRAYLRRQKRL